MKPLINKPNEDGIINVNLFPNTIDIPMDVIKALGIFGYDEYMAKHRFIPRWLHRIIASVNVHDSIDLRYKRIP